MQRANSMVWYSPPLPAAAPADSPGGPIRYRLKKKSGGRDPFAQHPADWSYGLRVPTCDCMGLVAWCWGFDRYQAARYDRGVNGEIIYDGWINTDSMILGSHAPIRSWFDQIPDPEPGAIVVYGSRYRGSGRRKPGHTGIVVDPIPEKFNAADPDSWKSLRVIHCSSRSDRKHGAAIQETNGAPRGRRPRSPLFLRYTRAVVLPAACSRR